MLIGVVQGISPTLEEASQTLRAKRWTTFWTVTLPLMRPGLANAFLLGFVESLADFGNPLVLGGNFEVLSTKIFFAVVGAAHDQGRAAVLSIVLLAFTLGAFWLQHAWLGKQVYTTVTGKGDAGLPHAAAAPRRFRRLRHGDPVGALHLARLRDHPRRRLRALDGPRLHADPGASTSPAFAIEWTSNGLYFGGSAWNSFFATVEDRRDRRRRSPPRSAC